MGSLSMMRALALLALVAAVSATELTPSNWDSETAGKTVFVKFLAPWRGHCKSMKPAWDKLMKEYEGHKSALVADVDCTAAGKPLCDSNGVRGFPTIKYGDPSNLEAYQGGRDFNALKKFADENLKPVCSPVNIDLCDATQKAEIEKLQALSADDLASKIAEEEKKLTEAEETFKSSVSELQKTYEKLQKEKEATIAAVKAAGLGLMKSVQAAAKK